jgi:hypothetical protein
VVDRLKHFRAGLLLALSSVVIFWPISYWFPLPEYLGVLASEDYADYSLALRSIVIIYLVFFLLNLITAGLSATKLSHKVKFWLALGPAAITLVLPFILIIPTALSFPDRNYFEIFQAMYRLLRFASPQLLALALICTVISVALNIRAALMFRSAPAPEAINAKLRTRYFVYAGVSLLVLAIIVPLGAYNGALRSQDRAACNRYAALEVPQLDEDVPTFLSEIRVIGESAGNRSLQNLLINFSEFSRQYLALLDTEPDGSIALKEMGLLTAKAKDEVAKVCSEYGSR